MKYNGIVFLIIMFLAAAGAAGYFFLPRERPVDIVSNNIIIAPQPPAEPPPVESDLLKNEAELLGIADDQNPKIALAELRARMQTDHMVFKNCHGLAHDIGHEAYKKYQTFAAAIAYQDTVCSDGYLHGVIEQQFINERDDAAILRDMLAICAGVSDAARCYHGVGHGLMYYTANSLSRSLALCDSYRGEPRARCNEGVFMENFLSDQIIHPSTVDQHNPFYPCPEQASRFRPFCYFYAPIFYLSLHDDDYVSALAWCGTAADDSGQIACARGSGSLAMKYNISDPKKVEGICGTARANLAGDCLDGMVSYFLTYYESLSRARAMCAAQEAKNQASCAGAVSRRAKLFVD